MVNTDSGGQVPFGRSVLFEPHCDFSFHLSSHSDCTGRREESRVFATEQTENTVALDIDILDFEPI